MNRDKIYIKCTISPFIEQSILENKVTPQIEVFFSDILHSFRKYQYSIFLSIPNSISYTQNKKITIFFAYIKSVRDSNIIIDYNNTGNVRCPEKVYALFDFDYELYSLNHALTTYQKRSFGFLIGIETMDVIKKSCSTCDEKMICKNEFITNIFEISSREELNTSVAKFSEISFEKNWFFDHSSFNETDIKKLFILFSKISNQSEEKCSEVNNFKILDCFLNAIKRESKNCLIQIFQSLFRCVLFPSANSQEREPLSIDYHSENRLNKYKGFFIYRLDALNINQSGLNNSGIRRIWFIKKDSLKHFLTFSNDHDVPVKTIKYLIDDNFFT